MTTLQLLEQHIEKNWEIYTAFASAVTIAAVCTMPETFPKTIQEWWSWARNSLQTAVPAARAAHSGAAPQNPTPGPQAPQPPKQGE